jgi:hypothetical protein
MLHKLSPWLVASATILASAAPATAQTYDPRYPVCMQVVENFGGTRFDCSFTSIPQCRATALGRAATCLINPYFRESGTLGPRGPYRPF